jgi:hypothetical protein
VSQHPTSRPRDFADLPPSRARPLVYPWLVAALGICIALSCLPFLAELPIYLEAARVLAAGGRVIDGFYPIGYPVALAPFYALLGLPGVIAFQALLYAVGVWLFFRLLGAACPDKLVVRVATVCIALHPYLLLGIRRINDNALNVPLLLLLLGLLTQPRAWAARGTPVVLGLAIALFIAIRPNALLLALLPLVLLAAAPRGLGRASAYLLTVAVGFAVISRLGTGAWWFFPGNGPYNLFAGTNPLTAVALRDAYNGEPSVVPALAASGVDAAPLTVPDRTYYDLVAGFLTEHPLQALALIPLKLANLFRPDWQFADDGLEALAQALVALPLLLWLAAWCGDASYRQSRHGRIFVALVVLFLVPFALTNSDPRFRLPLDIAFLLEAVRVFGNSRWPVWLRGRWARLARHSRRA